MQMIDFCLEKSLGVVSVLPVMKNVSSSTRPQATNIKPQENLHNVLLAARVVLQKNWLLAYYF